MTSDLLSPRAIAVEVLGRVQNDGAYASLVLHHCLASRPQLSTRDRALTTELVYGCLRVQPWLRQTLRALSKKPLKPGDFVELHLLVAAYQLQFLDRVPPYAAVDAAVRAVRAVRGAPVAGFANAVLRRFARERKALDLAQASWLSCPEWLRQRLQTTLGEEEARALLIGRSEARSTPESPNPSGVWVRLRKPQLVGEAMLQASGSRWYAHARRLVKAGDPGQLPGFDAGAFVIQELGSQLVALALGARPGERILDACSGHGQKTLLLRDQLGDTGELWASDLFEAKLEQLRLEFARVGARVPHTRAVDLSVGCGALPDGFDRVLIDAPCSGTGTLWHRPEITARLRPEHVTALGAQAAQILRQAGSRLRPGGRLVYAVCSVLAEEGEHVVAQVADLLCPLPFDARELGPLLPSPASTLRLLPARHATDGFFLASLTRV